MAESFCRQKVKRRDSGLFICLFGEEDYEAGTVDWMVKRLMRCAPKMGRDFIWHRTGPGAMNDAGWLTDNLEKCLARNPSWSNMAWLQEPASVGQLPEVVWLVADMG